MDKRKLIELIDSEAMGSRQGIAKKTGIERFTDLTENTEEHGLTNMHAYMTLSGQVDVIGNTIVQDGVRTLNLNVYCNGVRSVNRIYADGSVESVSEICLDAAHEKVLRYKVSLHVPVVAGLLTLEYEREPVKSEVDLTRDI